MINENELTRKLVNRMRYIEERCDQKKLWKSVICQAIEDATSGSKKPEAIEAKKDAIAWLLYDDEDFPEVCELAKVNPKVLRTNLSVLLNS